MWIASHNLIDSVIHGRRSGTDDDARRKPLATEVIESFVFASSLV